MRHTTITYVLIGVVLICPYVCLGDEAGAEPASCATCGCCGSHQQEQPGGEAPGSPADQDADCFCHGAIMDGQLRTAELEQANPPSFSWLIDHAALPSTGCSLASISFEPPHQFPPFATGRDVCMLTCTLML